MYKFIVTILFISNSYCIGAQELNTSLLWEITGKNLKQPSYLFGTFHLLCESDFSVTPILKEKISSSKQFFGEIDLSKDNWQQEAMMLMILKGSTLEQLMDSADYTKAKIKFKEITGMELSLFNNFKPFMAMSLLALGTLDCPSKIQPETEFLKIAQENHIPSLGLETIADQMAAIDEQPIREQIRSFKESLFNYDSVKQGMQQMLLLYKKKNIDSLYAYIKANGGNDDFETALLTNRNKRWMPVILKAMENKKCFFAVGAGHLAGNNGIINLLKEEGYTVRPIKFE
ncbi:MAG: TraB/GumN family protein [Sediminibacterium sp.]|nr:TraB/GumN family protein [Sediminibacterium sp.]